MTLREALAISLPLLQVDTPEYQSSPFAVTRCYPLKNNFKPLTEEQFDLVEETLAFAQENTDVLNRNITMHTLNPTTTVCSNEHALQSIIEFYVNMPINDAISDQFYTNQKGFVQQSIATPIANADGFAYNASRGVFAVCEVKTFWGLRDMPPDKNLLCNEYDDSDLDNPCWRAIAQIYGYMLDENVCYGVLTTFNTTWFLYARGEMLYISDGFSCDRVADATTPSFLQLLFYFYWKGRGDTDSEIAPIEKRPLSTDVFSPSSSKESSSQGKQKFDSSSYQPSLGHGDDSLSFDTPSSKRFKSSRLNYKYYSFKELSLQSSLRGGTPNVNMLRGFIGGNLVAVKLFDLSKGGKTILQHALDVYENLERFQGVYVSRIIGMVSAGGNMEGYCMEFAAPIKEWTTELKKKANHVLTQLMIHAGFIQHDIHEYNFGVNSQDEIVVLDMDQAEIKPNLPQKEKERYLKSASRVIKGFKM